MTRISNNFKMSEFSVSESYPKLATGVPCQYQPNIVALVLNVLQPICDNFNWRCVITSGYRSQQLNKAVGGVESSQHRKGEAADCVFTKNGARIPIFEVFTKINSLKLPIDQLIVYPTFVHISHTTEKTNRKQILYNKSYAGKRI